VLGYLQQSKKQVLVLRPSKVMQVEAFIDASFATHPDGKSHTGLIVKIGGAPVFCASNKNVCAKVLQRLSWLRCRII
jgi:hypothetical protein